jgi:hypothetical protein
MGTNFEEQGDLAGVVTLTFTALDQRTIDRIEQAAFARELVKTEVQTTDHEGKTDGRSVRVYPGVSLAFAGALAGGFAAALSGLGGPVALGAAAFGALLGFTAPLLHPALRKNRLALIRGPGARVDRTFAMTISADELSVSVDGELAIAVEIAAVAAIEPRTSSAHERQLVMVQSDGTRIELPMRFASLAAMHALARRAGEIMREQRALRGAFRGRLP